MDSITPGVKFGGEVTRAVQISRMGNCRGEQAAALVAMQKLFSLSAFFFINLFAIGHLIGACGEASGKTPFLEAGYLQVLIYGILIVFLLMFFCLFLMPQRIKTYFQTKENTRFLWMLKIKSFFLTLLDQVISIRQNTKICIVLFLLSFLIWLIYPAKMYLLAVQVFPGVPVMYIGAVTFVSYMVAMLPIFPGGLGGFEGTMIGLLLAVGFLQSDAFIVTVVFRFVTFWFVMLFSIVFIAFYRMRLARTGIHLFF